MPPQFKQAPSAAKPFVPVHRQNRSRNFGRSESISRRASAGSLERSSRGSSGAPPKPEHIRAAADALRRQQSRIGLI